MRDPAFFVRRYVTQAGSNVVVAIFTNLKSFYLSFFSEAVEEGTFQRLHLKVYLTQLYFIHL